MTRHLLFIPAEVVATKLTDAILGDSYAPMAGWYGNSLNPPTADVKRVGIYYERSSFDTLALTLIYDGKTINEACDRLARATGRYDVLPVEWDAEAALVLARVAERAVLGTALAIPSEMP